MFALVQMHTDSSHLWPLRILRLTWCGDEGWLFENTPGYFRVLAVFDAANNAKAARRKLSPYRYFYDSESKKFLLPSLMEIGAMIDVMQAAGLSGCLYRYSYRKESFVQWLKQQRP